MSNVSLIRRSGCYAIMVSKSRLAYAPFCSVSNIPKDVNAAPIAISARKKPGFMKIFAELAKARLSALVVITSGAGFFCAGAPILWDIMALTCVGTGFCAASAASFNQVIEKDRDSLMNRTKNRPLPAGHISPPAALAFGAATGTIGTALLAAYGNPLAAGLGLFNIWLYAVPYTLSKPKHEINTWIGSLVGAIPPVMGWLAATGGNAGSFSTPILPAALEGLIMTEGTAASILPPASTAPAFVSPYTLEALTSVDFLCSPLVLNPLLLSSILFLWQFPHFFALSWMHREDYGRGGFEMVACNDASGQRSADLVRNYTVLLATVPVISTWAGITNYMFAVEGTILNAYFFYLTTVFSKRQSNANARRIFLTSLWYLPLLLGGFVFYNKNWDKKKKEKNGKQSDEEMCGDIDATDAAAVDTNEQITAMVSHQLDEIRDALRGVCPHEVFLSKHEEMSGTGSDADADADADNTSSTTGMDHATAKDKLTLKSFCPPIVLQQAQSSPTSTTMEKEGIRVRVSNTMEKEGTTAGNGEGEK